MLSSSVSREERLRAQFWRRRAGAQGCGRLWRPGMAERGTSGEGGENITSLGVGQVLRKPSMALFTPSESAYLTSFLSAVDLDSSVTPDGNVEPRVADRVPHLQGTEALTKATKDLMALDVPVSSTTYFDVHPGHAQLGQGGQPAAPSYWPSIPTSDSGASLASAALKFGTPGVRSSSPAHYLARGLSSSSTAPSDPSRSLPRLERQGSSSGAIFDSHLPSQPHLQIAPLRGFDPSGPGGSSGFTLPPISTSNGVGAHQGAARPAAVPSPASASSVLSTNPTTSSSTSVKRPLSASAQSAVDPSAAKRLRRSPSSTPFSSTSGAPGADPAKPRRSASGPSKSTPGAPPSSASGNAGSSSKGALLSPSQKRANHIQSEQKRRANIRRGYEALCDTVPALREAIRAEEERERTKEMDGYEDPDEGNGKGKARGAAETHRGKKKKGRGEAEKPDGRAGPRSENVVLQKSACLLLLSTVISFYSTVACFASVPVLRRSIALLPSTLPHCTLDKVLECSALTTRFYSDRLHQWPPC